MSSMKNNNSNNNNLVSSKVKTGNSEQSGYHSIYISNKVSNSEEAFKLIEDRFTLRDKTNHVSDIDFKQWFVGLVDREGNFDISHPVLEKGYFAFRVRIKLHIDDVSLLNYIKERLNCA